MAVPFIGFRDKGIESVKVAIEADNAGNYASAYEHYVKGLDCFKLYLKYEKNENMKKMIEEKFKEYLKRAEEIKKLLDNLDEAHSNPGNGSAASTTAQKLKRAGSKDDGRKAEEKGFRDALSSAIVTEKPNVKWDDVAGLENAKEALKEAVILPVKFPQFFTGKRKPWSGILLYGPPGTGKSYLAKAVATEADSTFFSVSSSDLVSKWLGESEKLVANLFAVAREKAPSIIFIDEVDSLCSSRGDNESEAARRIKTQLMVEMQGVGHDSDARVLVLAATNLPYALDQAIRRRFDKRIYIPLPDAPARAHMFKVHLGDTPNSLADADFMALGEQTEGYSGSDISVVVKDVLMQPIRTLREATHFHCYRNEAGAEVWEPCPPPGLHAPPDPSVREYTLEALAMQHGADKVVAPRITRRDFDKVLTRARPTVSPSDLDVFVKFTHEFGEDG